MGAKGSGFSFQIAGETHARFFRQKRYQTSQKVNYLFSSILKSIWGNGTDSMLCKISHSHDNLSFDKFLII